MNRFQQEWQSGNSITEFPFLNSPGGTDLPGDFIIDLRLFLTGTNTVEAFLSSLSYDQSLDEYSLVFSKSVDEQQALSGSIKRLNENGSSRVGQKQFISLSEKVCLFTPGKSWDAPEWGGGSSWSITFSSTSSKILSDNVNPGPSTIRRIGIEGLIADESLWPRGVTQQIVGGYNIGFSKGGGALNSPPDIYDVDCIGGAGAGYAAQELPVIDYVATFQGSGPDQNGNINIEGFDCLRVFQPKTDSGPIADTIQITSDCLPCCGCSDYLNASRAVARRSAKVKDLCDRLGALIESSSVAYNIGVEAINRRRKPLVIVRNVRALGSSLSFSVQNLTDLNLFAYVAFRVISSEYALGASSSLQSNIVALGSSPFVGSIYDEIITHKATLMDLPYDISENPLAGFPENNFEDTATHFLFCVGERKNSDGFFPISPGALVEGKIYFADRALEMSTSTGSDGSVASALPELSFCSVAVYGASKSFSCSADKHQVKVIIDEEDPDEFDDCDRPFANDFKTVVVV